MSRGEHSTEERAHRQSCRALVACPRCGAVAGEKCIGARGQKRASNHVERWLLFDPVHIAAKSIGRPGTATCPNCTSSVANHPENSCVLAALITVIRERGTMSERKLRQLHAKINADSLWDDIGKIVDAMEEGFYK